MGAYRRRPLAHRHVHCVIALFGGWFAQMKKALFDKPLDLANDHRVDHLGSALAVDAETDQIIDIGDDFRRW